MSDSYDRVFKENFKDDLLHLIELLTGRKFIFKESLPTDLGTTLSSKPDFLHLIKTEDGKDGLLHMEFQTQMEKHFTDRMMLYQAILRKLYPQFHVWQYAIYLGESDHNSSSRYDHPDGWQYSYRLLELRKIPYETFLNSDRPEEVLFAAFADYPKEIANKVVENVIIRLRNICSSWEEFTVKLVQLHRLSPLRKKIVDLIEKQTKEKDMPIVFTEEHLEEVRKNSQWYKEGKQEGLKEVAKKMLAGGVDPKTVAEMTGLPLKVLTNLGQ